MSDNYTKIFLKTKKIKILKILDKWLFLFFVSKYKIIEIEIDRNYNVISLGINLEILNLSFSFNFYDRRHWNNDKKIYYIENKEEIDTCDTK